MGGKIDAARKLVDILKRLPGGRQKQSAPARMSPALVRSKSRTRTRTSPAPTSDVPSGDSKEGVDFSKLEELDVDFLDE